jgi:ABC-type sulfate transport system permease subunit
MGDLTRVEMKRPLQDPSWVRWTLTVLAVGVLLVLVVIPVLNVFWQALAGFIGKTWSPIATPDTRSC